MLRSISLAVAVVAAFAVGSAHAQGVVRVEPRPFYGAVVTVEEGVRVFRPLPADRYIVINPGHGTPLSLGIQDTRVFERRDIRHHYSGVPSNSAPSSFNGGAFVPGFGFGARGRGFGFDGRGSRFRGNGVRSGQRRQVGGVRTFRGGGARH